jgi:hypothetical protein
MVKRLLGILVFIICSSPVWAQGSFVQPTGVNFHASCTASACTSNTLTGQAAGNANLFGGEISGVGVTVTSVSSANSNTCVVDATESGSLTTVYVGHCYNINSGTETITAHLSVNDSGDLWLGEYHGMLTTAALDQTAVGTGTGTSLSAGPVTTVGNNEIIVVMGRVDVATTMSAGSGSFTLRAVDGAGGSQSMGFEDYAFTNTAGAYTGILTSANSSTWEVAMATYKTINTSPPTHGGWRVQ